jgi:aspartyl-tRNA(Asn)/glutamyl-tRNA(Gln) amidotransferase subunit A
VLPEASAYHQQMLRDSADLYTDEVRLFLEVGELMLATDYVKALRARTLIQQRWRDIFSDIDVLIAPTLPAPAVSVDDPRVAWPDGSTESATDAYVRFSAPANVTGLPSLSVPCGFTDAGLPIGMQIVGKPFAEPTLLALGRAYESSTDWPKLAPLP